MEGRCCRVGVFDSFLSGQTIVRMKQAQDTHSANLQDTASRIWLLRPSRMGAHLGWRCEICSDRTFMAPEAGTRNLGSSVVGHGGNRTFQPQAFTINSTSMHNVALCHQTLENFSL